MAPRRTYTRCPASVCPALSAYHHAGHAGYRGPSCLLVLFGIGSPRWRRMVANGCVDSNPDELASDLVLGQGHTGQVHAGEVQTYPHTFFPLLPLACSDFAFPLPPSSVSHFHLSTIPPTSLGRLSRSFRHHVLHPFVSDGIFWYPREPSSLGTS